MLERYFSIYYRTARCTGLSTSAAAAGLIASVVTLAISPLSFLSIADKFKRANKIEEYSQRFKNLDTMVTVYLLLFTKKQELLMHR